jgi:rRNA-processing protein FCF1
LDILTQGIIEGITIIVVSTVQDELDIKSKDSDKKTAYAAREARRLIDKWKKSYNDGLKIWVYRSHLQRKKPYADEVLCGPFIKNIFREEGLYILLSDDNSLRAKARETIDYLHKNPVSVRSPHIDVMSFTDLKDIILKTAEEDTATKI